MMGLFKELKRRNVFKVGIAYLVLAWIVVQVTDAAVPALHLPDWVNSLVFFLGLLGFPFALFFAWVFELTPEGIKKESEIEPGESIATETSEKMSVVIIGLLVLALGYFVWERQNDRTSNDIGSILEKVKEDSDNNIPADSVFKAKLGEQSIAVLPFANRSNLADDLFFTDGIHDDLLTQLAKIKDLKVISRTSVMSYRETDKNIPQIAEELGVANILEGGVQRAGNRIRVNAQLIKVDTDEHLWAETFDREMTVDNLFEIQSEITKQIVNQIKGQLTEDEQHLLEDKSTNSLAAWEAYSKARALLMGSGYNFSKHKKAEPLLEQAVVMDVNFTLAHAALANLHGMLFWMGVDQTIERKNKAKSALDKAIELAPNSAEVLSAQGEYFYRIEEDFKSALAMQNLALKAKPSDTDIMQKQGLAQRRVGLLQESINSFLQAYQLDPNDQNSISSAIETLDGLRDFKTIEEYLPNVLNKFPNSSELTLHAVAKELSSTGNVINARQIHNTITPIASVAYTLVSINLAWYEQDPTKVIQTWQIPEIQQITQEVAGFKEYSFLDQINAYQLLGNESKVNEILLQWRTFIDTDIRIHHRKYNKAIYFIQMAEFYFLMENKDLAKEYVDKSMLILPLDQDAFEGTAISTLAVFTLAKLGHRDQALKLIEELLELPNGYKRWDMYLDPRWDFFRDDERFNKLIEPHNLDQSIHAFSTRRVKES